MCGAHFNSRTLGQGNLICRFLESNVNAMMPQPHAELMSTFIHTLAVADLFLKNISQKFQGWEIIIP